MSTNKTIVVNNYKKYWIEDTKQGHLIKICYGDKDKVMELDLRWNNRIRDNNNRVNYVKIRKVKEWLEK